MTTEKLLKGEALRDRHACLLAEWFITIAGRGLRSLAAVDADLAQIEAEIKAHAKAA